MSDHPYETPEQSDRSRVIVDRERKDRAESLRLAQLALHLDLGALDLIAGAHYIHTGHHLILDESGSPDAARWSAVGERP